MVGLRNRKTDLLVGLGVVPTPFFFNINWLSDIKAALITVR